MWDQIIGQERAVEALKNAVDRPVHAYLIIGPRGSGADEGARALAGALVEATGDTRVARGRHPDVVEFRPTANEYSIERDVRESILPEMHAAPIEGPRKCVLLLEAERLNDPSANALLKSIEEPPPRTVVILVADSADALPATIRSRCQRIDFGALTEDVVLSALEADGIDLKAAQLATSLAGGRLDRARLLSGDFASLRLAFSDVPSRFGGFGASAAFLAAGLTSVLDDAVSKVEAEQAREIAEADAEIDRMGYAARTAQPMRKRMQERQKRMLRRSRTDALLEGLAAMESVYRDALAPDAPPLNIDRAPLSMSARDAIAGLDAVAKARKACSSTPTEALLLERLILNLPTSAN